MSVQIILKNSSVEDKRPTANQLANGEVSLNYDEAGAFLCCRDDAGNIQQVGGIKISEDAPGTPVKGTLWLQPSTSTLYVHNGTSWLSIAGGGGGGGGVAGVNQIIGADGIDIAPASGTGIVSVNADIDTNRGLEFVAGEIAVNLGAGLSFNSTTGAIDADNQALTYKGTVDLTASAAAPASPAVGDTYANTGDGNFDAVWLTATGLTGPQDADPGDLVAWNGTVWTFIPTGSPGGGGGGITNLTYTPTTGGTASQGGTVNSSTGTDADIPMVGHTEAGVLGGAAQAGLMHPDDKALIDQLPTDASGNLDIGTVTSITPGAGLRNDATAGLNATAITDTGTISIGLTAASGLELDPAGTSGGLQVDLQVAGAATGGLELDGNEIKVNEDTNRGLSLTAAGLGVNIVANGGLEFDGGALQVDQSEIDNPPTTLACMPAELPAVADREDGLLWYNEDDGRLYIWFTDVNGDSQFVDASPDSQTQQFWTRDAGTNTLEPETANDNLDMGSGDITTTGDLSAGTGTFSGRVDVGNPLLASATNRGVLVSQNGQVLVQRPAAEDDTNRVFRGASGNIETFGVQKSGTVLIGGDLSSTAAPQPNITLNTAGVITAGSYDRTSTTTAGCQVGAGGTFSSQRTAANASTGVAFQAFSGANQTVSIMNDGTTNIGGTLPASPNITLNANGRGVFSTTNEHALHCYNATTTGTAAIVRFFADVDVVKQTKFEFLANGQARKRAAGVEWSNFSDIRLKNSVEDYTAGLSEIQHLRPVTFKFNDDTTTNHIGLIAQEAETVMPEMFTRERGEIDGIEVNDLRMMEGTAIKFALINAVKEMATRIEALEAEVQTLKEALN